MCENDFLEAQQINMMVDYSTDHHENSHESFFLLDLESGHKELQ